MSEGAIISLDPRASAKVKRPRLVRTHAPKSRLRCILPILRFRLRQASGERRPIFITHLGDELFTLTNVTRHQARTFRVQERTVFRWVKRFLKSGYRGLFDSPRRDRGIAKLFANRDDAVALVLLMHLDGVGTAVIHKRLVEIWARLHRDSSRPPSYATLRNFLKAMAPPTPRADATKVRR